jgi:superfamily II DNA or RNA helicase
MNGFDGIRFTGTLRPTQERALEAITAQLDAGRSRLHIVAPPGSGKTVLGLHVWAHRVRRPAVVLSPTTAIQSQWLARMDLFDLHDVKVSDDANAPGLLTSLTYQSVTLPRRADEETDEQARLAWAEKLVVEGHADDVEEAWQWIVDLAERNPAYYKRRLSVHRRAVTEAMTRAGLGVEALHESSRAAISRLRDAGVGIVILDECHHLLGHWGRVLDDAHDLLDGPIVLGLTATPPDSSGCDPRDYNRYSAFLGDVDF